MPPRTDESLPALLERSPVARGWLALALAVLVLAGLFALAVVIARTPPFDRLVADPLFFKRCLVAHVNLALVAWFYSFTAALLALLHAGAVNPLARHASVISGAGVTLLLLGVGVPGSQPVLSNYVPTVDHWLFRAGQVLFTAGVLASLTARGVFRGAPHTATIPDAARHGLRAAAAALLLAAATFAIAVARQPVGLAPEAHYELLFWGAGHVLQLVCGLAMVSLWLVLLASALGESPVGAPAAAALFFALAAPWAIAPLLALQGGSSASARSGFTHLMQWGIFPVVTIFAVLCVRALASARRTGRLAARDFADPRIAGFAVSVALTALGFGLGAAIRGSNTMVPAHYHASVGGVTVAFMTSALLLLGALAPTAPRALRRAASLQPVLYGAGMLLFAAGFALAGAHGMGRKMMGAEQAQRTLAESAGLAVMGAGGFVAAAGGVLFLVVAIAAWRARSRPAERALLSDTWRWTHGSSR